ncbi:hypothetical protein RRG08_006725 [Elysia crispata]|uniref:Uncharacterized protein n=1 Tax=Elysia crispata TaxID=231223 RepID=A0AAE1BGB6_9GAST|nr:hypothetical protein RRG08_006725 [Elysia crispata]
MQMRGDLEFDIGHWVSYYLRVIQLSRCKIGSIKSLRLVILRLHYGHPTGTVPYNVRELMKEFSWRGRILELYGRT